MNNFTTIRNRAAAGSLYVATATLPFSILVCHVSIIVFIFCWITEGEWKQKLSELKHPSLIFLGTLAFVYGISAIYSANTSTAIFSLEKKLFFFILPFALITSKFPLTKQLLTRVCWTFCISIGVALIYCYVHALYLIKLFNNGEIDSSWINYLTNADVSAEPAWLFLSYVSLSGAINMHPTYLAMYCLFALIFLTLQLREVNWPTRRRIAIYSLSIFFFLTIIFLASRVVITTMLLFFFVILLNQLHGQHFRLKQFAMQAGICCVVVAGVFANPVTRYRQIDEVITQPIAVTSNTHYEKSVAIRASLWWLSTETFLESKLMFGQGIGDVEDAVSTVARSNNITNVLNTFDPHNQYLFFLISTGIVGLCLFLGYVAYAFFIAYKSRDLLFIGFLSAIGCVAITESILEAQKGIVFFTIFSAMFLAANKTNQNFGSVNKR